MGPLGPHCLSELFTFKNDLIKYNLRNNSGTLCLPKPCTNNMKKSFMFNGGSIWNSLPEELRATKSFTCFKRKLAAHTIHTDIRLGSHWTLYL